MTAGSAGEDDSDDDGEEDADGIQHGEARSRTMHEEHAGPVPADGPKVIRPGIVHRIDKGTSGTVRPILHAFLQILKFNGDPFLVASSPHAQAVTCINVVALTSLASSSTSSAFLQAILMPDPFGRLQIQIPP